MTLKCKVQNNIFAYILFTICKGKYYWAEENMYDSNNKLMKLIIQKKSLYIVLSFTSPIIDFLNLTFLNFQNSVVFKTMWQICQN